MKQTKASPELRFPEFEEEWTSKSYSSIFSFKSTNSFSRECLNYSSGSIKNLHYGDIHTKFASLFDLSKEHVPFINTDINLRNIASSNYCRIGDLVIADASENYEDIGKCIEIINLNGEKVLAGLHTFLARPYDNLIALGFGSNLMQSPSVRVQVKKIAQGTKVLGLSSNRLGTISLNIPVVPEQKKIAAFLSAVEVKILQLKQKKVLLDQYKKGVMQRIFNQEIRFKDEGKPFTEWSRKKVWELCEVAKSGGTPRSTEPTFYDGNIPFLSISDMTKQGKYLHHTTNHISRLGLENSAAWILPVGTIIYSMYASVGFVSINKIELATSQAVLNLILKKDFNTEFVYYSLVKFQDKTPKFITTGTQGNLNAQTVKEFELLIPSYKEQTKISDFLSAIDDKINHVNQQLEQARQFKKGLLQKMFV